MTANPGNAVTIPAGTQVATAFQTTTDSPVIYQTTGIATCPSNGGTVTVPVSQGVTYSMVPIGTTSGLPGQTLSLPMTDVIDGSVSIYVQTVTGYQQWTQVQYLVDSGPDDMVWSAFVDARRAD